MSRRSFLIRSLYHLRSIISIIPAILLFGTTLLVCTITRIPPEPEPTTIVYPYAWPTQTNTPRPTFTITPTPTNTRRPTFTPTGPGSSNIQPTQVPAGNMPTASIIVTATTTVAIPATPTPPQLQSPTPTPTSPPPPTFTPAPAGNNSPIPTPTPNIGGNNSPVATPASAGRATATSTPQITTPGWAFSNLRLTNSNTSGIRLAGILINRTNIVQEIDTITATFFDNQGDKIDDVETAEDDFPTLLVPPNGRIPFVILAPDIFGTNHYELLAESNTANLKLYEGFDFNDLTSERKSGEYCVYGTATNPGLALEDGMTVIVTLFDNQQRVIDFGYFYFEARELPIAAKVEFDVCIDTTSTVTQYEVAGWGE